VRRLRVAADAPASARVNLAPVPVRAAMAQPAMRIPGAQRMARMGRTLLDGIGRLEEAERVHADEHDQHARREEERAPFERPDARAWVEEAIERADDEPQRGADGEQAARPDRARAPESATTAPGRTA
jgi:hypothetical protein